MYFKRYFPTGMWCPPEGAAVAGAICGIAVWQIPWIAFFLPLLWILCRDKKWIFACFSVMTALSVWLQEIPITDSAPKSGKWVRSICRVTDPGLSRLPDISRPGMIKAELRKAYGVDGRELSISGRVMIRLPEDFRELVIDGGCHAGFGLYGPQEGDGVPAITAEEQIAITAGAIAEMVGG